MSTYLVLFLLDSSLHRRVSLLRFCRRSFQTSSTWNINRLNSLFGGFMAWESLIFTYCQCLGRLLGSTKKGEEDKNDHSPTWLTLHDTKVDWTNTGQRRSVLICPLGLVEQAGKYTYFPLLILHVTSRGRVYPVLTENRFDVVCSVICVAHHPGATEKMKDLSHKCQRAYITHMPTMRCWKQ